MIFDVIVNFQINKDKNQLLPIIESFQKIPKNDWDLQRWFWKDLVYFMEWSISRLTKQESIRLNRVFAELGMTMNEEKQDEKHPSSASSAVENKKGGVDFRALPIMAQPSGIVPLGGSEIGLSGTVPVNLDEEWSQIQNMLNAGIIPSSQRLKEFLEASCESIDCAERTEDALGIIADILRLEEERVAVTEPALRELLVLLESDKPANELQLALSKITVLPKKP